MDWAAALQGIDANINGHIARQHTLQQDQLDILQSARQNAAQQADQKYKEGLIDARTTAAEQALADKAAVSELLDRYNSSTDPAEKDALAAKLSEYKIHLPKAGATSKGVFYFKNGAKPEDAPTLTKVGDVPAGSEVIREPAASQQGYIPDDNAIQQAIDGAVAGDMSTWNALVARGGAGNATREALSKALGERRAQLQGDGTAYDPNLAKLQLNADKNSLKINQNALDLLQGYKGGLAKNLDLFQQQVAQLPDIGVPFLNAPIRTLDKKIVGDTLVTNAEAAAIPALREYVRMTGSSPNMTGPIHQSALDQANKVLGLTDETTGQTGASIAQINGAIQIMKQDMENVENGLAAQNKVISNRIANIGKRMSKADVAATDSTPTPGTVTPHAESAAAPKAPNYGKLPPPTKAAAGSKGVAGPAAVAALMKAGGVDEATAKQYLVDSGYTVR